MMGCKACKAAAAGTVGVGGGTNGTGTGNGCKARFSVDSDGVSILSRAREAYIQCRGMSKTIQN